MKPSWRRTLVCLGAVALIALSAGPAGARTERPAEGPDEAPIQVLATANRMINGDGGTSGKCMEIAGGAPGSTAVQMAPCQSYAHQGWTLNPTPTTFVLPGGNTLTLTAYRVTSHDRDAAGRCLTYTGQNVQARMYACSSGINPPDVWLKNNAPNGWFQLESATAYARYLVTGNPADRKCLDVHVDRTKTTNIVHHWTCGPLNKGNQLFRIQAA
jgi:hypothetical protein